MTTNKEQQEADASYKFGIAEELANCQRNLKTALEHSEYWKNQAKLTSQVASCEGVAWEWVNEPNGEIVYSGNNTPRPADAKPLTYLHPPTPSPSNVLVEAAQAVVERWDSPLWKDLPATATYINKLRNALATYSAPSTDSVSISRSEHGALIDKANKYDAINTPEIDDFLTSVKNEALHQRERRGSDNDAGKTDADWFWLIGYLAGKALHKPEKILHHIITTAAACLNWHAAKTGNWASMRPGIDTEAIEKNKE